MKIWRCIVDELQMNFVDVDDELDKLKVLTKNNAMIADNKVGWHLQMSPFINSIVR